MTVHYLLLRGLSIDSVDLEGHTARKQTNRKRAFPHIVPFNVYEMCFVVVLFFYLVHWAAFRGHAKMCAYLIARDASVNRRDNLGEIMLVVASLFSFLSLCCL